MRALLLLAVLGCGRVGFDLTGTEESDARRANDDGGGGDGGGSGGGSGSVSATTCTQPVLGCAFPGGLPCSCWGSRSFMNASMSESSGSLLITPNANTAGAQGMCVRDNIPFGPEGVLVEISQVLAGTLATTGMGLGTNPDTYFMLVQDGMLGMSDGSNDGFVPYDATAMRWWRIRPRPSGGVMFETSPDGTTWTTRYTTSRAPSTSYSVTILAGTSAAEPAPGSARFEGINICP